MPSWRATITKNESGGRSPCRQRLTRIAQSAKQNSNAKAIGIATALFNHRQVLFAKCVKTDQSYFSVGKANRAERSSAAVRMH